MSDETNPSPGPTGDPPGGWVPEFRCVCGQPDRPADPARAPWAVLAGYGDFQSLLWHVDEAHARDPRRQYGYLPDRPAAGDERWVSVGRGFADRPGDAFWCLYETPLAAYNGYGDDELDGRLADMALVRCRLDELASTGPQTAAARATVERVLDVRDLTALPLAVVPAAASLWTDLMLQPDRAPLRQGDLVLVQADLEGDLGAWALLHDTPQATDLLILAQWGAHADHLWAGRLRVRDGARLIGPGLPPQMRTVA